MINATDWINQQVHFLRTKQFDKLDLDNLIDEVEGVSRSDRRALESYLEVLLTHLLKVTYQADKRSGSWENSIANSQRKAKKILEQCPGLRHFLTDIMQDAYQNALEIASEETGIQETDFICFCPWDYETAVNWNDFKIKTKFKK